MAIKKTAKRVKKVSPKKAAASKTGQPGTSAGANPPVPDLHPGIMVSAASAASVAGNINVTFFSGVGQITASLFRNGVLINLQTISNDGSIFFSDIQSKDGISINGVCTGAGGASITISVPTIPVPQPFATGFIHGLYIVQ